MVPTTTLLGMDVGYPLLSNFTSESLEKKKK
jgi:hypothetical protein